MKHYRLTPQQRIVVKYRLAGYTYKQIAEMLKISTHTVKNYLSQVYEKLGVHNTEELYGVMLEQEVAS